MGLFAGVVSYLGERLGEGTTLTACTERSGPDPADDPFARGDIDVGFLCAPSVARLRSIDVLAAPVFADERAGGRPVYFSVLVVHDGVLADSLAGLAGRRVGFNDAASLSGYLALAGRLQAASPPLDVELVRTGGHLESITALQAHTIDAAAIDSNTILAMGGLPDGLRAVEWWGPYPVQPAVARITIDAPRRAAIRDALVTMAADAAGAACLAAYGVQCFVAVRREDYDELTGMVD